MRIESFKQKFACDVHGLRRSKKAKRRITDQFTGSNLQNKFNINSLQLRCRPFSGSLVDVGLKARKQRSKNLAAMSATRPVDKNKETVTIK